MSLSDKYNIKDGLRKNTHPTPEKEKQNHEMRKGETSQVVAVLSNVEYKVFLKTFHSLKKFKELNQLNDAQIVHQLVANLQILWVRFTGFH